MDRFAQRVVKDDPILWLCKQAAKYIINGNKWLSVYWSAEWSNIFHNDQTVRKPEATERKIPVTYGSAQGVTPVVCGWTRASHNHQNPKQTLQSPQTLPRWTTSCVVHTGAAWGCQTLFGHQNDVRERGGQRSFSYRHRLPPGSPVPWDLSSPQPVNPPIHLSPNRCSAHPGLAALAYFWNQFNSWSCMKIKCEAHLVLFPRLCITQSFWILPYKYKCTNQEYIKTILNVLKRSFLS